MQNDICGFLKAESRGTVCAMRPLLAGLRLKSLAWVGGAEQVCEAI